MNHYYRITAYHKGSNVCLIADSNGKFEKLWQFSSFSYAKALRLFPLQRKKIYRSAIFRKRTPIHTTY